jgi:hypothetical protein
MMTKLTREDLYSLEEYAEVRQQFRSDVMAHKKSRQVPVGPNATLYFEDATTMKYQVQEMLRIERIYEKEGIQEELDAYNPLVPDGTNWKATFMVEFPDIDERRQRLAELIGIEDRVWVQAAGHERVYAIADEDLEREDEEKTSSVHFLRFELSPGMVSAVKHGAAIGMGIDHDHYRYEIEAVSANVRDSLAADLR